MVEPDGQRTCKPPCVGSRRAVTHRQAGRYSFSSSAALYSSRLMGPGRASERGVQPKAFSRRRNDGCLLMRNSMAPALKAAQRSRQRSEEGSEQTAAHALAPVHACTHGGWSSVARGRGASGMHGGKGHGPTLSTAAWVSQRMQRRLAIWPRMHAGRWDGSMRCPRCMIMCRARAAMRQGLRGCGLHAWPLAWHPLCWL